MKDLRAAAEGALKILSTEVTTPGQFGREPIFPEAVSALRAALALPPYAEVQRLEAENAQLRAALTGALAAWDRLYPSMPVSESYEDCEFREMQAARAALKDTP